MRLVVDANIIVSAILGKRNPVGDVLAREVVLLACEAQVDEAARMIARIIAIGADEGRQLVSHVIDDMVIVLMTEIAPFESVARQRLGRRGQPDWPVLATAMTFDAHIWSNDRDFFGVGLPVWSMRNIPYAAGQGVLNG